MSKNNNTNGVCRKPLAAANSNRKPVVIKASKYRKILDTINANEINKKEAEEQQRYKDSLKKASDELVAKWGRSFKQSQETKQNDREKKIAEKRDKEKEEYQKIKNKEEQERREKIARAEEIAQKLKQGPKELKTAAMTSEIMQAREIQRNINKEFEEAYKKEINDNILEKERQAMPWIAEDRDRTAITLQRNKENQAEVLKQIKEKALLKAETAAKTLAAEKEEHSLCDKEIKAQIEKEQALLKRKRETLRKNALEAMIMVEQRRAREQYQDSIQCQLMCIYNEGKKKIQQIRKAQVKQDLQDHAQRNALNADKLAALKPDNTIEEENRLRKDISTIQLQFTAQEKEKIQRSRQQKYARIQEYFRELNAQKEREQRKTEETRFAMCNRFKNEEVNAAFFEKQKQEKIQKTEAVRKALTEQIQQRKIIDAEEKEYDKKISAISNSFEKDDDFFFDYADKLVAHAVKKERPLLPFVKAINNYKKNNEIDIERKLPPHLVTNLRIGLKTPDLPECAAAAGTPRKYGLDELKAIAGYSCRKD